MPSSPDRAGADRWERGLDAYASQFRLPRAEVYPSLAQRFGERFATEAVVAAGGAWPENDVLSRRDRSLIVVASLATQGAVDARLRTHVRWALDNGASPDELEALASLLAVYAGYPRASTALEAIREVTAEARARTP